MSKPSTRRQRMALKRALEQAMTLPPESRLTLDDLTRRWRAAYGVERADELTTAQAGREVRELRAYVADALHVPLRRPRREPEPWEHPYKPLWDEVYLDSWTQGEKA